MLSMFIEIEKSNFHDREVQKNIVTLEFNNFM
jgi:hypothetical protein